MRNVNTSEASLAMPTISVVVCTYNRAGLLVAALRSLCQQTLDPSEYEIIVVDNASTDNTVQIVQEIKDEYKDRNVKLIYEPQPGTGHARNTGSKHASGKYVAFMDDDARASSNWLELALCCFAEVRPVPLCIGGPILPYYNSPKPDWFKDEYEIRTWGDKPHSLERGISFSGSNMIFRKEIFKMYGGFAAGIGPKGENFSLGEDTILFTKIWKANSDAAFYYSPQVIVFHLVPEFKMTLSYRLKRAFASGQASYVIHPPESLPGKLRFLLAKLYDLARASWSAIVHLRTFPTYQNWIFEKLMPIAETMGHLTRCLGLSISIKQG